tara:strand:- start:2182 stop:3102 length:921 start_codon:yes stop_codon:yes gene_type:complete
MGGYSSDMAGQRDEEDELEDELDATEDELGDEDALADEEGDELDDMDMDMGDEEMDMGAEGGGDMVSMDDFMSALERAIEEVTGEEADVSEEPGDEEVEMDMEMGPEGDEMEMDVEEDPMMERRATDMRAKREKMKKQAEEEEKAKDKGRKTMNEDEMVAEIVRRLGEEQKYGGNRGDIPDADRKKKGHHGRGGKTLETAEEEGEVDYKEARQPRMQKRASDFPSTEPGKKFGKGDDEESEVLPGDDSDDSPVRRGRKSSGHRPDKLEEDVVNEVARRVARRLQAQDRKEQMVDQLAERIMKRLVK